MLRPHKNSIIVGLLALGLAGSFFVTVGTVLGETNSADQEVQRLQAEINAKNSQIRALEEEAARLQSTIADTAQQAASLSAEIKRINTTIARLQAQIKASQQKIQRTNLEIKSLAIQISTNEADIRQKKDHVAELFRILSELDKEGAVTLILKHDQFSEAFSDASRVVSLQNEISSAIMDLHVAQRELGEEKSASESKVKELQHYVSQLSDQKTVQAHQQSERAKILQETKNQEQKYRDQLADNEAKRKALEDEILSFENQLHVTIDPSSLPQTGTNILGWPVPQLAKPLFQCGQSVLAFLTQCFGNTAFARSGAYSGKGHNGVDLRADVGTPIYAAEAGTVRGTGDTDLGCRKASYGRWILLDHSNNLSTLYAHLSLLKVSPGQSVGRGELIGYSGRTGYALGPHLHFTVFVKAAVKIGSLHSRVCGRIMTLPLSPLNGYLNPLGYL